MSVIEHIRMLDDLIRQYYDKLKDTAKNDAKLEGLLKMIDMRRKLAPGDADQDEFWKILEDIRKEVLPEDGMSRHPKAESQSSADKAGKESDG